ncbi:MAG TPA: thioesterase [Vicinamibacterales bacterium]|nr:thioesterase [Vicinamibacterales bacterium]HPK70515.1 thioesterase [Vicinamibacterales bacterium]
MPEKLVLDLPVAYSAVDRDQVITLRGVFACFQEAAIAHANELNAGTHAMAARGEAWVLKRMAAAIERYPGYGEALRIETWSSAVRGAKGYREFLVFGGAGEPVFRGSSVWVYVSLKTRSIVRVPAEVAEGFPSHPGDILCPDLEDLELPPPGPDSADVVQVSLRYSDVDAMQHVNNTSYFDLLQTALARLGRPSRPRHVRVRFGRGISSDVTAVEVRLARSPAGEPAAFSVALGNEIFARGDIG